MKIHFASGTHPFPQEDGWTNTDTNDNEGVDVFINLLEEFPDSFSSITTAYVGHFLEHLTHEECVEFLGRILERSADGAHLVIVGPDVEKATEWYRYGRMGTELYLSTQKHGVIPADEPWNRENVHVWDCTAAQVIDLCTKAGWNSATEIPIGMLTLAPIIDASDWQFCVTAVKSA